MQFLLQTKEILVLSRKVNRSFNVYNQQLKQSKTMLMQFKSKARSTSFLTIKTIFQAKFYFIVQVMRRVCLSVSDKVIVTYCKNRYAQRTCGYPRKDQRSKPSYFRICGATFIALFGAIVFAALANLPFG